MQSGGARPPARMQTPLRCQWNAVAIRNEQLFPNPYNPGFLNHIQMAPERHGRTFFYDYHFTLKKSKSRTFVAAFILFQSNIKKKIKLVPPPPPRLSPLPRLPPPPNAGDRTLDCAHTRPALRFLPSPNAHILIVICRYPSLYVALLIICLLLLNTNELKKMQLFFFFFFWKILSKLEFGV